jgi:hypothetical protein
VGGQGGYAAVTAQGLFGSDAAAVGGYGVPVDATVIPFPGASVAPGGEPGGGTFVAIPRNFWSSSGFGLLILVAVVLYLDVRVLNR